MLRSAISRRLKAVLDRRYVIADDLPQSRASLAEQIDSFSQSAGQLQDELARVTERLNRIEERVSEIRDLAARGAAFTDNEDPHELRKRLFAAYRLANEDAVAIERLHQKDIILRRDLDALSASFSVESGP